MVQGTPVLVVDDNAENRQLLEEVPRSWAMEAVSVPGGAGALLALRDARRAGTPYRLGPEYSSPLGGDASWSETFRAVQDDPVLLATIVNAGLEEIPRLMSSIERAVADENSTDLRLAAHTLKGSLRCWGSGSSNKRIAWNTWDRKATCRGAAQDPADPRCPDASRGPLPV